MSIASTCSDLRRWGREGRKFGDLGYPSIVSFMKIRLGRSATTIAETDPIIDRIEQIVSRGPTHVREVLIFYYVRQMSIYRIAKSCCRRKDVVRKVLDEAEWYVHTELEKSLDGADQTGVYGYKESCI